MACLEWVPGPVAPGKASQREGASRLNRYRGYTGTIVCPLALIAMEYSVPRVITKKQKHGYEEATLTRQLPDVAAVQTESRTDTHLTCDDGR